MSIQNFSFQPQSVTINPGESITWTMRDASTMHTVTADDGSFSSSSLSTGQTYAHTFGQPGTFSYHCNIHPSMTGTVVVQGSGTPATQPPAPAPSPPAPPPQPAPAATPPPTAPRATAAPATTAAPSTTTSSPTTTIAPPAAADAGTTSSTLAAVGGGVALPAAQKSSTSSGGTGGSSPSPWLVALAAVLAAGVGVGGVLLRRRVAPH